MRRRFAGVAAAMALAAVTAAGVSPTASAACPNEAFRVGPSAALSECRAYEMVTPVDKESGVAVEESRSSIVSPSGDGLLFFSTSAYAGAEGSFRFNAYLATRADDAWATGAVGPRQMAPGNQAATFVGAVSRDLGLALVASREALVPGAAPDGSNLYLEDTRTGALSLIFAYADGGRQFGGWTEAIASFPFVGATPDWSNLLLAGPDGLYEFSGGQLRLAAPGASRLTEAGAVPNTMSTDGKRFYYIAEGNLYLHRTGQPSLLVSEDGNGNQIGFAPAGFIGATPNAEISFFRSGSETIYRFEASRPPGERLTEIIPPFEGSPAPVGGIAAVGEDGSHLYFSSGALLTPDAEPRPGGQGYDLYVWHGEPGEAGEVRYIGKSESEDLGRIQSVSPDGRFFGFESSGAVTPDVVEGPAECPSATSAGQGFESGGPCQNVFLYSYETGRLACVSCDGSPPTGNSRLGGLARSVSSDVGRPVLDDGMVLFDTPAALVPHDSDGVRDAYAWQDGRPQLISTGTAAGQSYFLAASADGSDLFFATEQSLVGQDIDSMYDVYDARVEGGLPQGLVTTTPCTGEISCRGGSDVASPPTPVPSASAAGAGNVGGRCLALKGKAQAATRRAHLLARRSKRAEGDRAKGLRRTAARESKVAKRLGRRAGNCAGGGR